MFKTRCLVCGEKYGGRQCPRCMVPKGERQLAPVAAGGPPQVFRMYSGLNGKAVTKRLAADAAVMARAGWIVVSQTKTGLVEYTVIYGRQGAPAGAVVVAPQPTPSAGSAAAPQPPSDSAPAFSVADELDKLATLRDRGILTPEEFAERKQRLLAV